MWSDLTESDRIISDLVLYFPIAYRSRQFDIVRISLFLSPDNSMALPGPGFDLELVFLPVWVSSTFPGFFPPP